MYKSVYMSVPSPFSARVIYHHVRLIVNQIYSEPLNTMHSQALAILTIAATSALAATITETANKLYTTTIYSASTSYGTTPDCGPFSTVAPNYPSCSPGCHAIQIPGAVAGSNKKSPWRCTGFPSSSVTAITQTALVTCGPQSTVTKIHPAYGPDWYKCTSAA